MANLVSELARQGKWTTAVAFRPDGKRFATAGDNGITVWEQRHGAASSANLRGLGVRVICLHWSPDGRRLAERGSDRIGPDLGPRDRPRDGPDFPLGRSAWHGAPTERGSPPRVASNQVRIWAAADQQPSGPVLSLGGQNAHLLGSGRPAAGGYRSGWVA